MLTYIDPPEQLLALPKRGVNTGNSSYQESAVPNAESARRIVNLALVEDQTRSYQRALVKGQYDGNPPYNQAKLNSQGMGWCTNLNWLGMEGRIDGARVPYYALFSGVPTYVTACSYEAQGSPDKARWELAYAKAWTDVHNRWRQFKWHIQAQQFEMLFEGWGPVIREDDSDWKFRALPARSLLVPQGANSCVDKRLPWIAVRVPYRIHELFDKIRNEKSAEDTGWNVKAVQDAIKWNTRGEGGYPYRLQQWEAWQQKFKNKELEVSYTSADIVFCDHLYVQEYSGKVSHFIFVEQAGGTSKNSGEQFLFERLHHYESYDQCIHVAFQNTGDGSWHSVRGMAMKSFKGEATMDRLQCRAVDNAFLSSGLTLQSQDQRSVDRRQLVVNQGVTWIPAGVTSVDRNSSHGQIEGVLGVARYVEAQLSQKLGNFQQQAMGRQDGRGEVPTAAQVQQAAIKEASLSNGQIDNYYLDLDTMYIETDRRLKKSSDPLAKWFREECERSGIPEEVMMKMTVRANRISGYGSPQMRKMALQESFQLAPMLNPEGKNNWLNEAIGVIAGPDKIEVWNPPLPQPDLDDAMIVLENVAIKNGEKPIVISGQSNVKHLVGHLAEAEQQLGPVKEAMDAGQNDPAQLQQALQYVSVLGPHCEEHLGLLRQDPTEAANVKLFQTQLKNLVGFNGKLYAALRRAQQEAQQASMEQQQANAIGLLDQAKLQSTQAEIERQDAKAQNDIALKTKKTMASLELNRWKTGQQSRLNAAKTAEEITHKRLMTAADIQEKKMNGSEE